MAEPAVTEKAFDEFHLYSIARATTLHDRETKQVEFVHAEKCSPRRFTFMTARPITVFTAD